MVRREGWSSGRDGSREVWQTCAVNCGSRCALRLRAREGEILWTETDCGDEEPGNLQMRACLRGRALRYWLGSPDRLNEPLRRVGPRGSGQFEPISWDEALDEIAERIRDTVAQWGNEAVLLPYATAIWSGSGSPFERLMNCYGGHLGIYGDYSCMQLQTACMSLYGDDGYYTGSLLSEASHADLVVFFGANPALTRMGGASGAHRLAQAREEGDSVGGVIECAVFGAPAGLGDPMFGGMENRIAAALFGIPAVKGVEFGAGLGAAKLRGSETNDAFSVENGKIVTETNRCGGILGGITDGMPIVLRAAFKPTPSIARTQQSVNLQSVTREELAITGRHDPCIVPRAVPCVEAAVAVAVYDALLARRKETR